MGDINRLNLIEGSKSPNFIGAWQITPEAVCNDLKIKYDGVNVSLVKRIDELKTNAATKAYENAVKYKLPDTTVKTCNYVTPPTDDANQRTKRIKDLYSSKNLNNNDKFNGKVTFN
jgi:hypothetical protein